MFDVRYDNVLMLQNQFAFQFPGLYDFSNAHNLK